jgi:hypothetical protein
MHSPESYALVQMSTDVSHYCRYVRIKWWLWRISDIYRIRELLSSVQTMLFARQTTSASSDCASQMSDDFHEHGVKPNPHNRRHSQMITHSSTSRPMQCICTAELDYA